MSANTFAYSAKIMSNGQIILPKEIRQVLGISTGDRVTFIAEGHEAEIVSSTVYAMRMSQTLIPEE